MPKVHLESWSHNYSTTTVNQEEAYNLEKKGYVVVEVSEEELQSWQDHLDKSNAWNAFWKKLSRNFLKEKYPELEL